MQNQFYYKNNRFQQLKGFCAVADHSSISKAAKYLNLTQGAVSLQIKSLERDLGIELFKREKGKIYLTKEGSVFYGRASASMQGISQLFTDFVQYLGQEKLKTIRIAANNASICNILPQYIYQFELEYPEVEFQIRNLPKHEAINLLNSNEIDLIIYSLADKELPEQLDFIKIVSYQPILLTKKDHPITKKDGFKLLDIAQYKLLRLDRPFTTIPNFDEIIKIYNFQTRIEFEMVNYEILKKFVKAGIGVAIVVDICLEDENPADFGIISLLEYFPKINYGIWFKKGKEFSGLLGKFVKMLSTKKLLRTQLSNEKQNS